MPQGIFPIDPAESKEGGGPNYADQDHADVRALDQLHGRDAGNECKRKIVSEEDSGVRLEDIDRIASYLLYSFAKNPEVVHSNKPDT